MNPTEARAPTITVKITVFKNPGEKFRIIVHELCGINFSGTMLDSLKNMFGLKSIVNFKKLSASGACVVDVRTKKEFENGHINGSVNIPLNELKEGIDKLNKNATIIVCCASGLRSASARNVLLSMGYNNVHNGGCWMKLKKHFK